MKQINIKHPGNSDVLFIEEVEIPQPKENELLVKVAYAGVNRPDIMQRQGLYPMPAGVYANYGAGIIRRSGGGRSPSNTI